MKTDEALEVIMSSKKEAYAINILVKSLNMRMERISRIAGERSASLKAIQKINQARIKDEAIAALTDEE